jgi:prepilin-type N-terminal cleavage/methylation domain-containing protein
MNERSQRRYGGLHGFTIIELIIAIIVVAILSSVALVGVAGMTHKSSTTACAASADAATVAASAYYTKHGTYPSGWADLTDSTPPLYTLRGDVAVSADAPNELEGKGWTLTLNGGGGAVTTFACS